MLQQKPKTSPRALLPPGPNVWDAISSSVAPDVHVRVAHGLHDERLPVAGQTVGAIRRRLGARMDVPPEATAWLDGRAAGEDVVVQPGQHLLFAHKAGSKGCRS